MSLSGENLTLPTFKQPSGEWSPVNEVLTSKNRPRQRQRPYAQGRRTQSEAQKAKNNTPERREALIRMAQEYREKVKAGLVKPRRRGPDGFRKDSGRRRLAAYMEVAKGKAQIMIDKFVKDGILDADAVSQAILIDQAAIVLARKPDPKGTDTEVPIYGVRERQTSARMVLEWCKAKPALRVEGQNMGPDQFLAAVAEQARTVQHEGGDIEIKPKKEIEGDVL